VGQREPYNQLVDHKFIKPVRQLRSFTLQDMSIYMDTDPATISKLENNVLNFSPLYESRFKSALTKLKVTNAELVSVRTLINNRSEK
jgi:transcriptional regulator with XRE-family HTH domain